MNQILEVRSNAIYTQEENKDEFILNGNLELVIIHTNSKNYELVEGGLTVTPKIADTRFLITPEMLAELLVDLQFQQKKIEGIRNNAEKLNGLVKYLSESEK